MENPGANAAEAPENRADGNWRAAFGSLRAEVVGLEGEVKSIGNQLTRAIGLIDTIGNKVDAIGNAQVGMQHANGRISAQLILGMIAVITPIIAAAAALGHMFVMAGDAQITAQLHEARNTANEAKAEIRELMKITNEFNQNFATSIWTEENQENYDRMVIQPNLEKVLETQITVARIEERLAAIRENQTNTP
jgi:hypothetical protein